jgi:hypothetical protein
MIPELVCSYNSCCVPNAIAFFAPKTRFEAFCFSHANPCLVLILLISCNASYLICPMMVSLLILILNVHYTEMDKRVNHHPICGQVLLRNSDARELLAKRI